jgi:murein DD-endopeptidase MepM/ murein hydrolase activator NlpD
MEHLQAIEAENAKLNVNTRQLLVATTQLSRRIEALEDEAEIIAKAMQEDPLLRKVTGQIPPMGGSTTNVPTSELDVTTPMNLDDLNGRLDDLERELGPLDAGTKYLRSTPSMWPLNGAIGSHYGGRLDPFTGEAEVHLGVDIVAPKGTPIRATADGVVRYSARQSDYGNLIVLEHPNGFSTRYGHLSAYNVTAGQTVHKNDIIGYVGMTGRATAPHLHYEVRLNDKAVNPRPYLR